MKTITVRQLRDLLDGEDDDALVLFTADYGDRGHTEQALPLDGEIEEVTIRETAYSNSGFRIHEDAEDAEDGAPKYLLIR